MTTIADLDIQIQIVQTTAQDIGKPNIEFEQRWHELKLCLDDIKATQESQDLRITALENP